MTPEDESKDELLKPSTHLETTYDVASAVSSIVPWLGGPVSSVLSGMSMSLKMERIGQVLADVDSRVRDLESQMSKDYVETDEFQELLERALKQVAFERSDEKRKVYAAFLASDIESPGDPYDEKIRILRTLEELQADHIRMLKVMMQEPNDISGGIGSIGRTLQRRLSGMNSDRIADLFSQLSDMKLVQAAGINIMITPRSAEQLYNYITPYGKRFTTYIAEAAETDQSAA